MNKEIEVKILEIDVVKIEKRLVELGAQKVFDGEIVATAFDFPDKRLSKQEILVRLRKKGEKVEFTVKKLLNTDQAKISEENEVEVSNYEAMEKTLFGIGLLPKRGYPLSKHRVSYVLGDIHLELDTFPQFPTFLEIEAPSIELIHKTAQDLGFSVSDVKPWGVREVFAYYRSANKLQ